MQNLEQEQQIKARIAEAKKILKEAFSAMKQDWSQTADNKNLGDVDGYAWLELIGNMSDRIVELERMLDLDLQIANSFEGRLENVTEPGNDTK